MPTVTSGKEVNLMDFDSVLMIDKRKLLGSKVNINHSYQNYIYLVYMLYYYYKNCRFSLHVCKEFKSCWIFMLLFLVLYVLVSSANILEIISIAPGKSFIKMVNKIGTKMPHCMIPLVTLLV